MGDDDNYVEASPRDLLSLLLSLLLLLLFL
jgi:hypothetical protein